MRMTEIADADYQIVLDTFIDRRMTSMRDMLEYYNNLDVIPFLQALDKMKDFWRGSDIGLDMFECVSLPGLAERQLMKSRSPYTYFMLPQKTERLDNSDYDVKLKGSIVGGPAQIFCRYHEVGHTKIRTDSAGKDCKTIVGFDCVSDI
jgi:hypothetical protein